LLEIGQQTWIKQTKKIAILGFCLDFSHISYTSLVHSSILAVLVNKGCAEYCNKGAVALYLLTKYLGVKFKKLSSIKKIFIIKVFIL
jgi:hypothetical protein